MIFGNCQFAVVMLGLALSAGAQAQSTVAELLEKGGKQVTKAGILELMPMRLQAQWPTGIGEEELDFSVDGKISGSGFHYPSKTNSPAEGSWAVADDGKFCTPKKFTSWGTSTNLCWYMFKSGDKFFGAAKTDPGGKVGKINSIKKLGI